MRTSAPGFLQTRDFYTKVGVTLRMIEETEESSLRMDVQKHIPTPHQAREVFGHAQRLFLQLPVLALCLVSAGAGASGAEGPRRQGGTPMPDAQRRFLGEHCERCHGVEKQKGSFRVDDLPLAIGDARVAERWQKVLNAVNSGEMPPEDEKQPVREAKLEFLDELQESMVVARRVLADQGGVSIARRLNRREYRNTIHALLGVNLDVSELPADGGLGGFDTNALSLLMSGDQFEQYHALALEALNEVYTRRAAPDKHLSLRVEGESRLEGIRKSLHERLNERRRYTRWIHAVDEAGRRPENHAVLQELRALKHPEEPYRSWERIKDAPSPTAFGFVDYTRARHDGEGHWALVPFLSFYVSQPESQRGAFLTPGDNAACNSLELGIGGWPPGRYVVRVRVGAVEGSPAKRRFLEFGRRIMGRYTAGSSYQVTGTLKDPQVIEIPVELRSNAERNFYVAERGCLNDDSQGNRKYFAGVRDNGVGPDLVLWVDWLEIESAPDPGPKVGASLERAGLPVAAMGDQEIAPADLRAGLARFAELAYRGAQPSGAFLDRLLKIHADHRAAGKKPGEALRQVLAVVLTSPRFLYLSEPASGDDVRRKLTGPELASRLSYFLWGMPPDDELQRLGREGGIEDPGVLAAQISRLLDDARNRDFVIAFTHQWLGMDRLNFFQFNGNKYPDFDLCVKNAARQEVYETVGQLIRENGPLKQLLTSDHVTVNALMADYYGLPGVNGDSFRPVPVPADSPRGGFLGMAAVLAMGSNGELTSPVDRGAWVLRKLLHAPPPPAPPNVPQLARLEGKLLTTRERLGLHQEEAQCANCHRRIDPIGFGLENFDAAGQWRTEDRYEQPGKGEKKWVIDPAGAFHNGPAFKDYQELRKLVAERSEDFARGFAEALCEYGLGRPYGFTDEPLVDAMLKRGGPRGHPVRELVSGLVLSETFRSK